MIQKHTRVPDLHLRALDCPLGIHLETLPDALHFTDWQAGLIVMAPFAVDLVQKTLWIPRAACTILCCRIGST